MHGGTMADGRAPHRALSRRRLLTVSAATLAAATPVVAGVTAAYAAGPMLFYGGSPAFPGLVRDDGKAAFLWPFGFSGSAVGDMAWVGLALVHLYACTRDKRYLDGAAALGNWIASTSTSPHAFG